MNEPVSVSRRIDAPAEVLFGILADPARHPEIDGSGMVRGPEGDPQPLSTVGDAFEMRMHSDSVGGYRMLSRVVEYEPGRRIAWEPELTQSPRPEDQKLIGTRMGQRWGWELTPDGEATVVTEIYDVTRAPDWVRDGTQNGAQWIPAMTESLVNLERIAVPRPRDASR